MIINQIASGGGGLNTSDATAYPEHILKDYTAYARGAKITGTYEPSVYDDAIAIFPFDGNINNVLDNGNDFIADSGTPTFVTGKNGQAFSATSTVNLVASANLISAMSEKFTVAFWFKIESNGVAPNYGYRRLFWATINDSYKGLPEINGTSSTVTTNRLGFDAATGTLTYNDGNWHLGIVCKEKSLFSFYVDNNKELLAVNDLNHNYPPTAMHINHNSYILNGYIDNFVVWARVLSSNEREALWNNGSGLFI